MACEIIIPDQSCPTIYQSAISEIAANFSANLIWLDKVYSLAEVGEKPKGASKIIYPRVNVGKNDYKDLFPKPENGDSYCFFELVGSPAFDLEEKTVSFSLNVVFWVKYDEACGDELDPTHNLVQQIMYLTDKNLTHFVEGTVTSNINKEQVWGKYGYTFEELRQVEHPYTTFSIGYQITMQDGIECFDCSGGFNPDIVLKPIPSGDFIRNQDAVVQTPGRFDIEGKGKAEGFHSRSFYNLDVPTEYDGEFELIAVYNPTAKAIEFKNKYEITEGAPFIFTIDTTNSGTPDYQFQLPFEASGTYDCYVSKGDGSNAVHITSWNQAETLLDYGVGNGGVYTVRIYGQCWGWRFNNTGDKEKITSVIQTGSGLRLGNNNGYFYGCSNLESVNLQGLDLTGTNTLTRAFILCTSLIELDVSVLNLENIIAMNLFVYGCSSLTTLNMENLNSSSCTNFTDMAMLCTSLTDFNVSGMDVSSANTIQGFIRSCSSLTTLDVSNWDVSSLQNAESFANGCSSLITLDVSNWNTSSLINARSFIQSCILLTTIDVSNWNTENLENINRFVQSAKSDILLTGIEDISIDSLTTALEMAFGITIPTQQCTDLLVNWAAQAPNIQSNVPLHLGNSKYFCEAIPAITLLTEDYGWTISSAGSEGTCPVASFSVRKTNDYYTGSALRVRRSSDDTEMDIGFVGEDLDTATLLSFVGANDGFVTDWYDQSGYRNHLASTFQPKIVDSGTLIEENSLPAIEFDGVDDIMDGIRINFLTQIFSMTFVHRFYDYTDANKSNVFDSRINLNRCLLDTNSGNYRLRAGNNVTLSTSPDNNQNVTSIIFDSSSSKFYKNGVVENVVGDIGSLGGFSGGVTLGKQLDAGFYEGNFQEIVFYDNDIEGDVADFTDIINDYFNIF